MTNATKTPAAAPTLNTVAAIEAHRARYSSVSRVAHNSASIRFAHVGSPIVLNFRARGNLVEFSLTDFNHYDGPGTGSDVDVAGGSFETDIMEEILSAAKFDGDADHYVVDEDLRLEFVSAPEGGLRIKLSELESDCDGTHWSCLQSFEISSDGIDVLWGRLIA